MLARRVVLRFQVRARRTDPPWVAVPGLWGRVEPPEHAASLWYHQGTCRVTFEELTCNTHPQ